MIGDDLIVFGDGALGTDDKLKTFVFDTVKMRWKNPNTFARRPHFGDHTSIEVHALPAPMHLHQTASPIVMDV